MRRPMRRTPSNSQNTNKSNRMAEEDEGSEWSPEENKIFETALALCDKNCPNWLEKVAATVPGKTIRDVMKQYQVLEQDLLNIEAGLVSVPDYDNTSPPFSLDYSMNSAPNRFHVSRKPHGKRSSVSGRHSDPGKKRGVPWTEDEHRQFLMGLEKHGKGDWRNISRNYVRTRTPTQVASHAQKYFIRQLSAGKERRRASIHDITSPLATPPSPSPSPSSSPSPSLPQCPSQFQYQSPSPTQFQYQSCSPTQFQYQSPSPQQFQHQSSSPQQFQYQSSSPQQFQWSQQQQQQHVGGEGEGEGVDIAGLSLNDVPAAHNDEMEQRLKILEALHVQLDDLFREAQDLAFRWPYDRV